MSIKAPSEYSGVGTVAAIVRVWVTCSKSVEEVGGSVDGSERVNVYLMHRVSVCNHSRLGHKGG